MPERAAQAGVKTVGGGSRTEGIGKERGAVRSCPRVPVIEKAGFGGIILPPGQASVSFTLVRAKRFSLVCVTYIEKNTKLN